MPLRARTLLGPGPSNPYPEATLGLTAPLLGHLDPEFITLLERTCERLRSLWGTENPLTLPLSGTGSLGMETAFANTVHSGDVVVVAVNGLFGERMCEVAGRYGAEVVRVSAGDPNVPGEMLGLVQRHLAELDPAAFLAEWGADDGV